MGRKAVSEQERIDQINALPNIKFVRWDGEFKGNRTKVVCHCEIDGYDSWGSIKYVREYTVENGFEAHPEKLREFDTPAVKLGGWDCFFKTAITWQMQAKMVSMMLELNDFMLERYFKA